MWYLQPFVEVQVATDMSTKVTDAVSRHITHSKYLFVSLWDVM